MAIVLHLGVIYYLRYKKFEDSKFSSASHFATIL